MKCKWSYRILLLIIMKLISKFKFHMLSTDKNEATRVPDATKGSIIHANYFPDITVKLSRWVDQHMTGDYFQLRCETPLTKHMEVLHTSNVRPMSYSHREKLLASTYGNYIQPQNVIFKLSVNTCEDTPQSLTKTN